MRGGAADVESGPVRGAILLIWWMCGCGGATSPTQTAAETAAERADPLLGAWWTGSGPDGRDLPCPLEIEVFEDGTAELDFLNDDSEEKMCSFARVPAVRSPGDPPVVRFAGQLSACLWRREGPRLRLACEDHGSPPPDFATSILLERRRVRAASGLPALVGTWATAGFWSPSQAFEIAADGRIRFLGEQGRITVIREHLLWIQVERGELPCRYRAIEDRLTIRCGRPAEQPPGTFAAEPTLETLVLRRRGGPPPTPPRFSAAALSVADGRGGDRDGDGARDAADRCPDEPEDFDDFQDQDGCPEPDNDRDGVLDVDDRCPAVPENRDGREDADGCPESGGAARDRDGDGAMDAVDSCPDDPEDWDGLQDEDGCPDPDNDQDGILDVDDLCPNDPEDGDGFQDTDGCPDLDNDHDRVIDVRDACPNEPEDQDADQDEDGCPDP